MVLHRVVRAALQVLRNVGPLVAVLLVGLENNALLLDRPVLFVDLWVQMVVPPNCYLYKSRIKN